jgi:hypothetical protein
MLFKFDGKNNKFFEKMWFVFTKLYIFARMEYSCIFYESEITTAVATVNLLVK